MTLLPIGELNHDTEATKRPNMSLIIFYNTQ
jgi:hypothetical protein